MNSEIDLKLGVEDRELCTACGGICCKRNPGVALPQDYGAHPRTIANKLITGRWIVDWWEGDPTDGKLEPGQIAYFLRPAIKGFIDKLRYAGWGGECTFLTDEGCELELKDRPAECRWLVPADKIEDCLMIKKVGKRNAAIEWLKCGDALERAIDLARRMSNER